MTVRVSRRMLAAALVVGAALAAGSFEGRADVPPAEVHRVTVRMLDFAYEPSRVVVPAGGDVELTLVNEGKVLHEFVAQFLQNLEVDVEVNGVAAETLGVAELEVPAGGRVVLRFTPAEAGTFPFACHAFEPKDHRKAGMKGEIVVQDG